MMEVQVGYGWYGKVPCRGDFVRRGLSPQFVGAWDGWMQNLLLTGREVLGDRWQACYFGAPIWRFALSPGVCGPLGAAGIVMPSVDRAGRHFPLCLAAEVDAAVWTAYLAAEPVFDALEDTALAMLDSDATLEHLEESLTGLPSPAAVPTTRAESVGAATALVAEGAVQTALAALAAAERASIWVAVVEGRSRVLLAPNLPAGEEEATALFDLNAPWYN